MLSLQSRLLAACFFQVGMLLTIHPALAQTIIESKIAEINPCEGLKTKVGFVEVGIDRLKRVRLESADVTLRNDVVTVAFVGALACKTSDSAAISGDASASIKASSAADLATCEVGNMDVSLSDFAGRFGFALKLLADRLEAELAKVAKEEITSACRDFRQAS